MLVAKKLVKKLIGLMIVSVFGRQRCAAMRSLLLFPLLAACAPAHLEQAKARVDSRMTYVMYDGWHKPAHLGPNEGKCIDYANAYVSELPGVPAVKFNCTTNAGEYHQAVMVGDWVLDNRYRMVVPFDGYDCKPI